MERAEERGAGSGGAVRASARRATWASLVLIGAGLVAYTLIIGGSDGVQVPLLLGALGAIGVLGLVGMREGNQLDRAVAEGAAATERLEDERRRRTRLGRLAAEDEARRQQLADALHDGPIQQMASVGIRLGTLRSRIDDEAVRQSVSGLEETVRDAIEGIRTLIIDLAPPPVDADLADSVTTYADRTMGEGIEVDLRLADLSGVPEPVGRAGYAIVQHALANVRTHAHARHVSVDLRVHDDALVGEVVDDGVGAPPDLLAGSVPGHLGLRRMREQAEALGGCTQIASVPGAGVTVRFRVPFAVAEPTDADLTRTA